MAQTQPVMYDMAGPTAASTNVRSEQSPPRLPLYNENRATKMLLVYMIDYLEKHNYRETAEALKRESNVQKVEKLKIDSQQGLLWEWWACFWEIYFARVHPNGVHSDVAKAYSENLHQHNVERYRQSGQPPVPGAPGPTRPYVNGGPPVSVNGHAPSNQYPTPIQGVQGGPMSISSNSGPNPTLFQNPALQHLQQPPRAMNGKPFPGPGMSIGPSGVQYPMPPGGPMPPRPIPNGVPPQPNPNARPPMAQQTNSPQNPDSYASPKNPNPSDPSNPPTTEDTKMETPRTKPARGQKRPSEEESPPKGETPPNSKKQKLSSPGNGPVLPSPSFASAQPQGIPRPTPLGSFPNPTQVKPGAPMPMPPHPISVGGGPPAPLTKVPSIGPPGSIPVPLQNQLQHLEAAAVSHGHRTPDHQYFQQMSESTMSAYGVKPFSAQPTTGLAAPVPNHTPELGGPMGRPAIGATNGPPKGSMGPPPLPGTSSVPPTPTNAPKTTVNGLVPPANAAMKDGSPKIDGHSPENTRPGSRPISSTPQPTPSAPTPTGIASTPGGPSSISAPSPAQLATPQQTSRPHSQSPNARPSPAGAGGPIGTPAMNPSAVMARMQASGPPAAPNPTPPPALMNGGPTLSALGTGSGAGESLTDELFGLGGLGSLGGGMGASFEYQMIAFQEPGMDGGMALDFSFPGMEEFSYLDPSLDSMTGT